MDYENFKLYIKCFKNLWTQADENYLITKEKVERAYKDGRLTEDQWTDLRLELGAIPCVR